MSLKKHIASESNPNPTPEKVPLRTPIVEWNSSPISVANNIENGYYECVYSHERILPKDIKEGAVFAIGRPGREGRYLVLLEALQQQFSANPSNYTYTEAEFRHPEGINLARYNPRYLADAHIHHVVARYPPGEDTVYTVDSVDDDFDIRNIVLRTSRIQSVEPIKRSLNRQTLGIGAMMGIVSTLVVIGRESEEGTRNRIDWCVGNVLLPIFIIQALLGGATSLWLMFRDHSESSGR